MVENPRSAFASMMTHQLAEFGIEPMAKESYQQQKESVLDAGQAIILDIQATILLPGQKYGDAVSGESSGK